MWCQLKSCGNSAVHHQAVQLDPFLWHVVQCTKGDDSMSFSIRLTEEERKLADSYARLHSITLGEAFKRALFERIEDEYDIAVADEAYREYVDSDRRSRPIDELWKELDL